MKPKYIFDINKGHFIKQINEADENITDDTQQQEQQEDNKDTSTNNVNVKSVESNTDIQAINAKISAENEKFNRESDTQQKLLDQARKVAATKTATGEYDPVETDSNVLNIRKKINDLKKQHYNQLASLEDQKLSILSKLSESNHIRYTLPEKYKGLNESNIHTAKIYMGDLVGTDTKKSILKGMADFKRAFKDTNLLYGKDRQGYFLIILDQDDMDTMYNALDEVGYLRDDIIDTVMPQLFNRCNLIQ